MLSPRAQQALRHPAVGVLLIYLFGVALRIDYSLRLHRLESFISSDMAMYVNLARRLASSDRLMPWDVTHPLGYPALLAYLTSGGGSLVRVAYFQIVVSSLVPLAVGLLGWTAFGFRTALAATAVASLYFPFIEYGALVLSEIHLIFWLPLAFAAFFAARNARRPLPRLLLAAAGGLTLSIAASFKAVALFAGIGFFVADAVGLALSRSDGRPGSGERLSAWLTRAGVAALATIPLLTILARTCTRANRGHFCVLGKMGADFLLGHYGRIGAMEWADDEGHGFEFGSPGVYLRHYEGRPRMPFTIMDDAANRAEAWRWILAHPFDAIVLSLDHVYDTFFGAAMWPSYGLPSWPMAQLFQYLFVACLLVPTVFACARLARRGLRAFLTSRTLLVLSPVLALALTVAMATGEVRYRIPFDVFFITVAGALVVGDLGRVDGAHSEPRPTGSRRAELALE